MRMTTKYWLMKSEPECYSIDDLQKQGTGRWDGVRNYQVRNLMRDEMQVGDRALFYHSSAGSETGVAGEMEVTRGAYPDPTQFDPQSEHPDPKSDPKHPRWLCVDVKFERTFSRLVPLSELRNDPAFAGLKILERGSRLSITPVSKTHFERIVKLGTT